LPRWVHCSFKEQDHQVPQTIKTLRLACVWATVILVPATLPAQNGALHITVVSGQDAAYAAGAHATKPITIEVTDAAGQPVEGARASFQIPEEGPGGVLSSGLRTDLATTDSHGRATLRGFQLNRIAGAFNVRITAVKDLARAGIVVRQRIGEASDATGGADRKAPFPGSAVTADAAPAKAAPAKTESAETASKPAKPVRTVTPRAMEASVRPPLANLAPIAQTAAGAARIKTIVATPSVRPVSASSRKSHKKWLWIGLMAAGGAAGAFAGSSMSGGAAHGSGTAAGLTSAVSIGTPTITIGKP
jgi:hypothetical protein